MKSNQPLCQREPLLWLNPARQAAATAPAELWDSTEAAEPFQKLVAGYELATFDVRDRSKKLSLFFGSQLRRLVVLAQGQR